MSAHLNPLEAYRRDLARLPSGATSFGDEDDAWLLLAHVLGRRAAGAGAAAVAFDERDDDTLPPRRLAAAVAAAPSLDDGALVADVMGAAARMETAGALLLAASTLSSLERLLGDAQPLARGRVLAQWARVERLLGDTTVASDLYARAGRLGARANVPELRVRADLGLGVLARMRGNYPVARRRFGRALALAERAGLGELTGLAHQSLLVVAAVARDFDAALGHGWQALAHAAGDPAREADVLLNLATLCLDTGHADAALRGYLAAAERAAGPRVRVAAAAGAAVAAARTGDRALLAASAAAVEAAAAVGDGMAPYERAQRLLTLADAWSAVGDDASARDALERGLVVAREHGFAELLHEYDPARRAAAAAARAAPVPPPAAAPLGPRGARVVRELAALGGARGSARGGARGAATRRGAGPSHTAGFS